MTRARTVHVPSSEPVRAVLRPVVWDYLLSHLGFFAVLPVLPLLLQRLDPAPSAVFVGVALFLFNAAVRGASLFFSGLLNRTGVRRAMCAGLLLSAASFAGLAVVRAPVAVLLLLVLAGIGISTNGLMARVFVARSLPGASDRTSVFSAIQVAVNVSAAIGPVVANLLVDVGDGAALLLGVGAMYALGAVAVALSVPGGLVAGAGDVRPPLRWGLLRDVVVNPDVRRVSAMTVVGGFLYAQLFSALVLHVADLTRSPTLRGSFFVLNAVLVVLVQVPVSALMSRQLRAGTSPIAILGVGIALFGGAFLVLGTAGGFVVGAFVAVAVFSVGETFFTPMVSTAFGEIPGDRPLVELFNMRQVAATVGESTGSFVGGALFLVAADRVGAHVYWGVLAVVAGVVWWTERLVRRRSLVGEAPDGGGQA